MPKELIEEVSGLSTVKDPVSRSKIIRNAINDYINNYKNINERAGKKIGLITIIYQKNYKNTLQSLELIQEEFHKCIKESINIRIDEKQQLRVIIVEGDIKYIRELNDKLMVLKGVELVELISRELFDK